MRPAPATPAFGDYDEATFWPWLAWPEFATRAADPSTVVVVPVAGWAARGALPLDAEEKILLRVLREASLRRPEKLSLLVVPVLQFVVGPPDRAVFAVEPPLAHALLAEVTASIAAAGFRRIAFVNASPWNEALCDAAARDLRLALGTQMFCLHLSGLGFELGAPDSAATTALEKFIAGDDPARLAETGARLARLLGEVAARAPLPHDGQLSRLVAAQ